MKGFYELIWRDGAPNFIKVFKRRWAEVCGWPRIISFSAADFIGGVTLFKTSVTVFDTRDSPRHFVGGDGHPSGLDVGYFLEPTVFVNVTNDMANANGKCLGIHSSNCNSPSKHSNQRESPLATASSLANNTS